MTKLPKRIIFLFALVFSMVISSCNVLRYQKIKLQNPEKRLFGKTVGNKDKIYYASKAEAKAKLKQEAKIRQLKSDYAESIERSKKRTLEIQTPEVRRRMRKNNLNTELRDKAKWKKKKEDSKQNKNRKR